MEKELEKEFEKQIGIGKAKIGLVVCAVLVAILAVSNIWFYTALQNQTNLSDDLQIQKDTLQNQLSLLNTTYQNYVSTHNHSNSEYDSYVANHQYTNSEYDDYVADHHYTDSQVEGYVVEIEGYIAEVENLIDEMEAYVSNHHYTDEEYYEALFSYYYVFSAEQKFGVYDLEDELYGLEWIEPYEEGVFDCSEMSAYLEWRLENEGWHTIIVIGDSPFGSGYHAWLLVETSADHYMPVESTTIEVVWWDDPYFDNYLIYDYEFETIDDALAYSETEFDWWE